MKTCAECIASLPLDPRYGYISKRGHYIPPDCQDCSQRTEGEIEARLSNVESLVSQKGSIPKRFQKALDSIRAEIDDTRGRTIAMQKELNRRGLKYKDYSVTGVTGDR